MVQASTGKRPGRPASSGPSLVRQLGRLADSDAPEPDTPLPDRLSLWLAWNDAITLSAALRHESPAASAGARNVGQPEQWCARLRKNLTEAIAQACTIAPPRGAGRQAPAAVQRELAAQVAASQADYSLLRQRCLSVQQSMESGIGQMRRRLRALLGAAGSADAARLAAVDAAMEQALGARERNLLMSVPALLSARYEQLRREAQQASDDAPAAWLDGFLKEMRDVLLAELEVRFQPVEGLLAALRTRSPGSHVPIPR